MIMRRLFFCCCFDIFQPFYLIGQANLQSKVPNLSLYCVKSILCLLLPEKFAILVLELFLDIM